MENQLFPILSKSLDSFGNNGSTNEFINIIGFIINARL
jgi:hypothetical protein